MIGIKKKPARVSSWVKGATGLLVTAFVDMIVAFSTAFWGTWSEGQRRGGYGLWKMWDCGPQENQEGTDGSRIDQCQEKMADTTFPGKH